MLYVEYLSFFHHETKQATVTNPESKIDRLTIEKADAIIFIHNKDANGDIQYNKFVRIEVDGPCEKVSVNAAENMPVMLENSKFVKFLLAKYPFGLR